MTPERGFGLSKAWEGMQLEGQGMVDSELAPYWSNEAGNEAGAS